MLTGKLTSRLKLKQYLALILSAVLFISGIALYTAWGFYVRVIGNQMEQNGATVSLMMQDGLERAEKLLLLTRPRLSDEILRSQDSAQIDAVLISCLKEFGQSNKRDQFDLMILVDASGQLIAQSGKGSQQRLDFSDRYYFTDLRDHPDKKFTVGRLRIDTTTGRPGFHISIPLRDSQNAFLGILALQLDAEKIERQLREILTHTKEQVVVLNPNGFNCFQYPLILTPGGTDDDLLKKSLLIQGLIVNQKADRGGLHQINSGEHGETTYAITLAEDQFGLSTSVLITMRDLTGLFLRENTILLLSILIAILIILLLFSGLSTQARNLEGSILETQTDQLTGLRNRSLVLDELPRLVSHALRASSPLSVLFIDIDHFKSFNDLYGHDFGDKILQEVARYIADFSRRPLDYCCRWGGEEFVMILPDTLAEDAVKLANQLMECVGKIHLKEMRKTDHSPITLSIGIAITTLCPEPHNALIARADEAMLFAKSEGRNRVVLAPGPGDTYCAECVVYYQGCSVLRKI